jgi:ketosteroid isomerase-like protein
MLSNRLRRSQFLQLTLALLVLPVLVASGSEAARIGAALEAQVRATEIAFAKTMSDRDHGAFIRFLDEEAVFFSGDRALRGAEIVAAAWSRFYEGEDAPFSWAPEAVSVLESGTLGLSSGPVFDPEGKRIGTFNSVWRRGADGAWKVVFDRGCPDCECP